MGNRLHVQFAVLVDTTCADYVLGIEPYINRLIADSGLLSPEYASTNGTGYARLASDAYDADKQYLWLEVNTSFKNYHGEWESFWDRIRPALVNFYDKERPIGFWSDDNDFGLIFLDNPKVSCKEKKG